jgi:hypothetical protein
MAVEGTKDDITSSLGLIIISFFGLMKNVILNNVMIEGFHGRKD